MEHPRPCVNEGQNIGGEDAEEYLKARKGEGLQGSVQTEIYDAQNQGAGPTEYQSTEKEFLGKILCGLMIHFFMPILSFTVLSCLRET